jgi:hypothetical protein
VRCLPTCLVAPTIHTHTAPSTSHHELQEQLDSALFHFAQLLERQPRHYEALSQLLGLLRRQVQLIAWSGVGKTPQFVDSSLECLMQALQPRSLWCLPAR